MCQVLYIFVDSAITSCTINYAHFKHKKNNNSQAIWPNSSRTRISTQGFKTLPYLPGHSANQSKTMLSTLPPLSPQAPLIFHLTYPTSQDPATTSATVPAELNSHLSPLLQESRIKSPLPVSLAWCNFLFWFWCCDSDRTGLITGSEFSHPGPGLHP